MAKTFMDHDMDAELEGIEDSDEDMEKEDVKDGLDEAGNNDEDSDIDDDDDDDDVDEETVKKMYSLEEEIEANPYNYSAHTDLLEILRKGPNEKKRQIRERFSKYYPLTPNLWIDWTQDEITNADSDEDKKMISELFERGVKDYVSVDLWLEFCQFGIGGIGTPEGIESARSVFERGLTACGLHAGKGSLLWESYREFEMALLSLQGTPSTPDQTKKFNQQKQKIVNLFKRQLRLPHLNMEKTFEEYKEFVEGNIDPNVQREYQKATEKFRSMEGLEVKVMDKESSLDDYKEYLKLELKGKDPARIQLMYERTLTEHCLESGVWEEYLNYLDSNLRIDTVSLPVYERAVRNCPWSQGIWSDYIRALERFEKDHKDVVKVFEESLSVGFNDPAAYLEVWLAFIDYTRRRTNFENEVNQSMEELRSNIDRACDHLASVGGDPDCEMLKYYANIEADQFRDLEKARKVWADILQVHQFKSSVWMEAIQFEKIFGDKKHLRKRLERAMEKTHDDPESIGKLWLQFEREEGSLEAFDHCRKAIKLKLEKIAMVREKENRAKEDEESSHKAKVEKKKEKDKQHRRDKRHQAQTEKKQKEDEVQNSTDFKVPTSSPTVVKKSSAAPSFVTPSGKSVAPPPGFVAPADKSSVSPPPGYKPPSGGAKIAPPPGYKPPSGKVVEPPPGYTGPAQDGPPAKKQKMAENLSEEEIKKLQTVFLSNLDFEVDEDQIEQILSSSGKIKEIRLVKHPNGKSKGYAFVEFSTYEEALGALKRDNELIKGRPMYVSECDPEKKKGPVFKYNTGLEKKKLFVKGLDTSITKEDLTKLFSQYGSLADVRLVTYRNGHSKGLAFIDYNDEVDAAKALVKTDGMKLKEKEIQVAISNPPKRKEEGGGGSSQQPADMKSLGGSQQKDFGPRGKGRSQIAFMPRSVSVSVPAKPDKKLLAMKFVKPAGQNGTTEQTNESDGKAEAANGDTKSSGSTKSNSDFRNMLLGSK